MKGTIIYMKIYDISQEIFSSEVYPGDPAPHFERVLSTSAGDACNLTAFGMCAHNGTHVDAPFHFIEDGAPVDKLPLESLVGMAFVFKHDGEIGKSLAEEILRKAKAACADCARRILIKGNATVTLDAARIFTKNGVLLVGGESQTVGPVSSPAEVHLELLGHGVVLLEGVRLNEVVEGAYFLCAAPLKLGGADGAPVRAILMEMQKAGLLR